MPVKGKVLIASTYPTSLTSNLKIGRFVFTWILFKSMQSLESFILLHNCSFLMGRTYWCLKDIVLERISMYFVFVKLIIAFKEDPKAGSAGLVILTKH